MKPIPWDGNVITKAGIYSGVPIEIYHQQLTDSPSVSKSGLWKMVSPEGSPADLFDESYLNEEAEPFEQSEALILGRGSHHLLLGESDFDANFAIRPETYPPEGKAWSGNSGWCKNWLADRAREGRTVLKADHIKRIRGMSRSLAAHPLVRNGILNGLIETTLCYRDVETGIWVKVRPDCCPTDDLDVADLKTAASVSDKAIDRALGEFGYYLQGALVKMAFENVLGVSLGSFSLVFVESQRPHSVRVVTMRAEDLELGEQLARAGLRLMAKCLDSGVWPGPGGVTSDAVYAGITPWHRQEAEYRLSRMRDEVEAM